MSTNAPDEDTTAESGNVNKPPPSDSTPEWARKLQTTLEELPGKLKATVSDDDKSGIAESVHGLFERSGAFKPDGPEEGQEADTEGEHTEEGDTKVEHEASPKKGGWLSGLASKFSGDE